MIKTAFLDIDCTSAITATDPNVAKIYEKVVTGLMTDRSQWVVFNTLEQNAYRAPLSCVLEQDEIHELLKASDNEFNILYPQHKPWTTLLQDPEINPNSKEAIPIMCHIFPPSLSKQFPHIDSFGASYKSEFGDFRMMGHVVMISSGYLPKLFTVFFFCIFFLTLRFISYIISSFFRDWQISMNILLIVRSN